MVKSLIKDFEKMFLKVLIILLMSVSLYATQITPVSVEASSTFYTYNKDNLINNSGLQQSGLHDTSYHNMWISNEFAIPATLTFDLGEVYTISSTDIWRYSTNSPERSVKDFDIYVSIDNINFQLIASKTLSQSSNTDLPAVNIPFTATGKYIRFILKNNYGADYIGLSEVKFNGTAPVSVPLSNSAKALLAILFAFGAFFMMNRRKIA